MREGTKEKYRNSRSLKQLSNHSAENLLFVFLFIFQFAVQAQALGLCTLIKPHSLPLKVGLMEKKAIYIITLFSKCEGRSLFIRTWLLLKIEKCTAISLHTVFPFLFTLSTIESFKRNVNTFCFNHRMEPTSFTRKSNSAIDTFFFFAKYQYSYLN